MGENMITTIQVENTTRDRLKKHGRMDENYDQLLNRILDEREAKK